MEKVNNDRCFKTIAIVLSSISDYRPIRFGGMQQYFYNLSKYLSRFYYIIIFSSFRYKYIKERIINQRLKIIHLYFPSYDFVKMNLFNKILSLLASTLYSIQVLIGIIKFNKNINCIIFCEKLESIIPVSVSKILKIKTMYFEGNEYPWNLYGYKPSSLSWAYNILMGRLAINLADFIVAQNLRIKRGMSKYTKKKIEVVPISVDTSFFKPIKKGNKNVIGFLGRLEREKGMDLLLKILDAALEESPEIKFIILGKGSYEKEISKRKNLLYVKAIERKELPFYINEAIAFISCQEWIGAAEAEILACGRPLITLNSPVNSEVIKDFYNGFLCDKDPKDYVKKMKVLLYNENLIETMIKNCRQTAIEKFSIETVGEKWRKILES